MTKHISIVGCGWLGLPLAENLLTHGYSVKGSTRTEEKLSVLKSVGIDPYQVEFTNSGVLGDIEDCLSGSSILILNTPPGLRGRTETNYVGQIKSLMPYIESSGVQQVLFISSTSVYADEPSMPTITEKSIENPSSESGKQILEVEQLLKSNPHFETTLLRFGGLYGEDRHPAKSLSGREQATNFNAPVNLIHLKDCIGIIRSIIEQQVWGETFNASNPLHPTREAFYTQACLELDLAPPTFDKSSKSQGKLIDSNKLIHILDYQFRSKL